MIISKTGMIILYWIWQFPQMLVGVLMVKITGAEKKVYITEDKKRIEWFQFDKNKNRFNKFISGVSLAMYILLPYEDKYDISHEYGHSVQSKIIGILYLPVIGLYSAVFCNLWDRLFHKRWCKYDRIYWYYTKKWTERWADTLGKVNRENVLKIIPRPAQSRYPAMKGQIEA